MEEKLPKGIYLKDGRFYKVSYYNPNLKKVEYVGSSTTLEEAIRIRDEYVNSGYMNKAGGGVFGKKWDGWKREEIDGKMVDVLYDLDAFYEYIMAEEKEKLRTIKVEEEETEENDDEIEKTVKEKPIQWATPTDYKRVFMRKGGSYFYTLKGAKKYFGWYMNIDDALYAHLLHEYLGEYEYGSMKPCKNTRKKSC
jgi:hypothetical protein